MGDVADQLLVFYIVLNFLLRILFQTDAHLLKILTKLSYLVILFYLQGKVQIAVPDLSGGLLQLA